MFSNSDIAKFHLQNKINLCLNTARKKRVQISEYLNILYALLAIAGKQTRRK
jgi:hypothetical protein